MPWNVQSKINSLMVYNFGAKVPISRLLIAFLIFRHHGWKQSVAMKLQIILSITLYNENSQKSSLCYDVDFSKKCGRPGPGGLKIRTHADKGEGVKNGQTFSDVLYGWPLIFIISIILVYYLYLFILRKNLFSRRVLY